MRAAVVALATESGLLGDHVASSEFPWRGARPKHRLFLPAWGRLSLWPLHVESDAPEPRPTALLRSDLGGALAAVK
jgi:hypothetical protein